MKTSIHVDGTLIVRAENHLEAFALEQWADINLSGPVVLRIMIITTTDGFDDLKGLRPFIESGA